MRIIYRAIANDLDERFLDDLQTTYRNKEIKIMVCEVKETEYLLESEKNRKRLLQAKNNVEQKTKLVKVNLDLLR